MISASDRGWWSNKDVTILRHKWTCYFKENIECYTVYFSNAFISTSATILRLAQGYILHTPVPPTIPVSIIRYANIGAVTRLVKAPPAIVLDVIPEINWKCHSAHVIKAVSNQRWHNQRSSMTVNTWYMAWNERIPRFFTCMFQWQMKIWQEMLLKIGKCMMVIVIEVKLSCIA